MNNGRTIEDLISMVARVEARVQRAQSAQRMQGGHKEVLRFPAVPFRESSAIFHEFARVGAM